MKVIIFIFSVFVFVSTAIAADSIVTAFNTLAQSVADTNMKARAWGGSYSDALKVISAGRGVMQQITGIVVAPDLFPPAKDTVQERQQAAKALARSFDEIAKTGVEKEPNYTGFKRPLRSVAAGIIGSIRLGMSTVGKGYRATCPDQQACQDIFDDIDKHIGRVLAAYQ